MNKSKYEEWFENNRESILKDYFAFLRFQSISSEKEFSRETRNCAVWVKQYLEKIGMHVEVWETDGPPAIFASFPVADSTPTLLIYHHYDVQPVEPLSEWRTDPFEPVCQEGRVYARGASDNKGQCMITLAALKALPKEFRKNIKLLIEGEEEIGSPHLGPLLRKKRAQLKADYLLIPDVHMPSPTDPTITLGMRGILTLEAHIRTAKSDLHSGVYGGIALNPNRALSTMLSKLWDQDGNIAIPGFYEGVSQPTKEELSHYNTDFNPKDWEGVYAFSEEKGHTPIESNWFRPSLEINGMVGGYIGEGIKTIIPCEAHVKLSCRLALGQDPKKTAQLIEKFLKESLPKGALMDIHHREAKPAFRTDIDSKIVKIVEKSYEEVFAKKCKNILMGATIPIAQELAETSHGALLFIGVALPEDDIHAPNEHFRLDQFKKGLITMGLIFETLQ